MTAATIRRDVRHALRIGRVELRRTVRAILTDRRQLVALSLLVVGFTPGGVLFLSGAFVAGTQLGGDTSLRVLALARAQVVAWLGATTILFGLRMIERSGDVDHADLLLTTVRPRAVLLGLVFAEYTRLLAVFGTPITLVAASFALGAGTPLLVPAVVIWLAPLLFVGLLGGFVVGYLGRLAIRMVGGQALPHTVVSVLVILVILGGFTLVRPSDPLSVARSLSPLAAVPVGPYADLLLAVSPLEVTPGLEALVATVLLLSGIPLLSGVATRLASLAWFGEPVGTTEQDDDPATETRLESTGVPGPFARWRTTRFVWWLWLRGVRAPSQFVHLTYFLFITFPMAQTAFADPRSPLVPIFIGLLGAFLAGGAFGMNPLGVEGSMLPAILTTPRPGPAIVRARLLAGTLLFLPLSLSVVFGLGWYSTLGTTGILLLAGVVVVLTVASCAIALALGSFSPRFETVRAFGGVEAPTPTTVSLIGHTILVAIVAGLGLAAVFGPALLDGPPFVGRTELLAQSAGLFVWTAVVGSVSYACYQYAVQRVNGYTVE